MGLKIDFKKQMKGERILLNQMLLVDDKYIPKKIIGRKEEISELTYQFSNFFRENPSLPNLFIFGFSGTGKSLITNHIFDEFEKEWKKEKKQLTLKIVRIKATNQRSKYEILKKIHFELKRERSVARDTADIYEEILEIIFNRNIALLIFIDEIHELSNQDINSIIYTISRIGEDLRIYKPKVIQSKRDPIVGYVLISNDPNLKSKLKSNTRSGLYDDFILFKRYDADVIKDILLERIEEGAIRKDSIEEGVLDQIAAVSVKEGGDARYSLLLLRNCSIETQKRGLKKITKEVVTWCNLYLKKNLLKEILLDLPSLYIEIIFHIYVLNLSKKDVNTGTVFRRYAEENKSNKNVVGLTRISQIVTELESNNVIYTTKSEKKGRTRNINIDETMECIEEVLEIKGFI